MALMLIKLAIKVEIAIECCELSTHLLFAITFSQDKPFSPLAPASIRSRAAYDVAVHHASALEMRSHSVCSLRAHRWKSSFLQEKNLQIIIHATKSDTAG